MEFENLIGLRGPLSTVLRNLIWILAFQTSFIFLFCCIPCIVGSISFSILSKNALIGTVTNFIATKALYLTFDLKSRDGAPMDWIQTIRIMNEENERLQTLIQPRDVSMIVFGYLTYGALSFSFSGCIGLYKRYFKGSLSPGDYRGRTNLDEMNADEIKSLVMKTLTVTSKCASAASKISLLVCFKMFALPFILGIWLDLSTLQLFGANIEDRLASAGADLIVAFILHWVVGITFMLTITVSILQLREVLHPDLLAPIIRPQEPQPDLLLQLLQDSGLVHLKRMIPSVAIYASLLCIHVWLPCRLLRMFGAHDVIPLFRPKFWHIINPGLQSAIELFCFHLAILSVLEKQKNAIGLVQHKILMKLSNWFGLTKSLLPFATSKSFALVGEVQLRGNLDEDHVDRNDHDDNEDLLLGLSELYKKRGATDLYLESKLKIEEPSEDTTWAENIITPDSYIVIAPKLPHSPRKVMRTHMGKYRFRKRVGLKGRQTIEIWREVATEPIPRPPEDWDYLADDNNVDKGRWAWGTKEKKSEIERNVASRELIFPPVQKNGELVSPFRSYQGLLRGLPTILKLASIALVSWVFATIFSSFVLFGPLIIGRFISRLLHVPNEYIHDPFLFFVGCILIAPAIISFVRNISTKHEIQRVRGNFLFPPFKKQLIMFETLFLWLAVCPLFIGVLYDTFLSNESLAALLQAKLVHMMKSWVVGFLLLHLWGAAVYYSAFRRKFWSNVRTLAMEGIAGGRVGEPNRNNNRMVANNPRLDINAPRMEYENDHLNDGWQGDDGRVGKCLNCIHSAFWMFEWDKMDKDILLEKTLYPIVHNVLTAIVIPMAIFLFTTISFGVGVIMYRASITVVLLVDMFIALKEPLKKWYISAHKAARDHRYLIGKVLLNYENIHK
jgi:E3 ubiquitin-protein ligase MARCH6